MSLISLRSIFMQIDKYYQIWQIKGKKNIKLNNQTNSVSF